VVLDRWEGFEMLVKKLFVSAKGFDTVDTEYVLEPLDTEDL
jgi:hypothetical protein